MRRVVVLFGFLSLCIWGSCTQIGCARREPESSSEVRERVYEVFPSKYRLLPAERAQPVDIPPTKEWSSIPSLDLELILKVFTYPTNVTRVSDHGESEALKLMLSNQFSAPGTLSQTEIDEVKLLLGRIPLIARQAQRVAVREHDAGCVVRVFIERASSRHSVFLIKIPGSYWRILAVVESG
jgi:hypothetical protein